MAKRGYGRNVCRSGTGHGGAFVVDVLDDREAYDPTWQRADCGSAVAKQAPA